MSSYDCEPFDVRDENPLPAQLQTVAGIFIFMGWKLNPLIEEQVRRNLARQQQPTDNRAHRENVTQLLIACARSSGSTLDTLAQRSSLCLLGPGYGQDFEGDLLVRHYAKIHLVDVDIRALAATAERLQKYSGDCCVTTASFDVSGIFAALDGYAADKAVPSQSLPAEIAALLDPGGMQQFAELGRQRFRCVASTCLLTELIDALTRRLNDAPALVDLILGLRRQHLQRMVAAIEPGGHGLLITDFVSSETLPGMVAASSEETFQELVREAVDAQNFFTGCNPLAIRRQLQEDAWFSSRVDDVQLSKPWRWSLGSKQMAVVAARFRRRG